MRPTRPVTGFQPYGSRRSVRSKQKQKNLNASFKLVLWIRIRKNIRFKGQNTNQNLQKKLFYSQNSELLHQIKRVRTEARKTETSLIKDDMECFSNASEFFKMILISRLQINKAIFCYAEIHIYKPRHFIFKLYRVHLYLQINL